MLQGSSEWIEWRQKGIGASEVAAILGICPYNTPHGIWLVKTGRSKGFDGNSFTQHGQETEARARARYELVSMEDMPPACATHPSFPICRVSLDGFRSDGKLILEIKCPKGQQTITDALAGKVPDHYLPQVQYQLAVTGADLAHFFVYHEDSGQHALVEVAPDVAYQGKLIAAVTDFWQRYVLTDTPPPLTPQDVKVVDDVAIKAACLDLLNVKDRKDKTSKVVADSLKALIIELGGHNKVRCGNVLVSKTRAASGKDSYRLTVGKESA